MSIVEGVIHRDPKAKVAVIDKDEPGGICLTRGCIPSKMMVYPAELLRLMGEAEALGIRFEVEEASYAKVMGRMRTMIDKDIESIHAGLSSSDNIDYFQGVAEFVAPYTLRVGEETLQGEKIILTTGSKPAIPPIEGIQDVRYHTSDSVIRMQLKELPKSLTIIGGGYIAAEFGHFSAMGSNVTIVGRNQRFLPDEEPEVSFLAKRKLGKYANILTGHEVKEVEALADGKKRVLAVHTDTGSEVELTADEILVAAGRSPENDLLHPEKGGVRPTSKGWIAVNEYMETSQPNVWSFGDADGTHLFKHVANYEAEIVYRNAVLNDRVRADYHAVPYAVFTYPEIAAVGLREKEAVLKYGENGVLIGFQRYQDTAKGEAMNAADYFVKLVLLADSMRIVGAHIIGPQASVLIQEVINVMYTHQDNAYIILRAIHIHPALSEVVQRALWTPVSVSEYHSLLEQYGLDAAD